MKYYVDDKEVSIEELKAIFEEWTWYGHCYGVMALTLDDMTENEMYFGKSAFEC